MVEHPLDNETRFRLLRLLTDNPNLSQRDLARELGISLGKLNYCLNALLDVGYVKAANFKQKRDKQAYLYKLTPKGVAAKASATMRFLEKSRQNTNSFNKKSKNYAEKRQS